MIQRLQPVSSQHLPSSFASAQAHTDRRKILPLSHPIPSLTYLCVLCELCVNNTPCLPLTPLFATDPRNPLLSPIIATLPKTRPHKSFVCHTSKTPHPGHPEPSSNFQHSTFDFQRVASSLPYVLPSSVCSKSFVSHSYENCRGGGLFFPNWSTSSALQSANITPPLL